MFGEAQYSTYFSFMSVTDRRRRMAIAYAMLACSVLFGNETCIRNIDWNITSVQ